MLINPRRALLWLVIAALLLWILSRNPQAQFARIAIFSDFMGYWSATRLFLANSNPYDNAAVSAIFAQYGRIISSAFITWAPPWIYLALTPFAMLNIATARLLWFVLSCVIIMAFANYMWGHLGGPRKFRPYVLLVAMLFVPSALALRLGQTTPLVLAGLLGFFWALRRGHFVFAGLCTYMLTVKPHIVYLFWYFLALWIIENKRYRVLLGIAVGIAAPTMFCFAINPSVYDSYFQGMQGHQGPLIWATPTLGTLLRMCFHTPSTLVQLTPTLCGLAVSTFLWKRWRKSFVWEQHGIETLVISAMTCSYAWTFDWLILLPALLPIVVCACRSWRNSSWWIFWSVAIQGILLIQLAVERDYVVTAWFPFAMAALYWSHNQRCGCKPPLNLPPADSLG
jgi:hypothetical protein